jgi:hypothetical protein
MALLAIGIATVRTNTNAVVAVNPPPALPPAGSRADSILLSLPISTALRAGDLGLAIARLDAETFTVDTSALDTVRLGVRDASYAGTSLSARAHESMRTLGEALATRSEVHAQVIGNADARTNADSIAALGARLRAVRAALAGSGLIPDTVFVRTPATAPATRVELLLIVRKRPTELR